MARSAGHDPVGFSRRVTMTLRGGRTMGFTQLRVLNMMAIGLPWDCAGPIWAARGYFTKVKRAGGELGVFV